MINTKDIDPQPDDNLADQESDLADTQAENSATPQNQTTKINLNLPQPGAGGQRLKKIKVKITPKIPGKPQPPEPPAPPTPSQTTPSAQKTTSQLPTESQHEESQSPESPLTQTLKDRFKEEAKKRLKDRAKKELRKKALRKAAKKEARAAARTGAQVAKVGAQLAARAGVALAATVEVWGPILLAILLIIILIILAIGLFAGFSGIVASIWGNRPETVQAAGIGRSFASDAHKKCGIPERLVPIFSLAAHHSGVDANFIAAIAAWETREGWQTDAGPSSAGARGIMQITPETYIILKLAYDNDFKKLYPQKSSSLTGTIQDLITDPPSPEYSIVLGAMYLKQISKLDYINGNLRLMAAAYNAGPYAKAIQQRKIPEIKETQQYVDNVLRLNQKYEKCLKKDRGIAGGVRLDLNGVPLPVQGPKACAQYSMTMVENYYRVKAGLETITPDKCEFLFRLSALNDRLSRINGAPQYADLNTTSNDPRIIDLLVNSLNNGHPVIWPNNFYSGGHFVVFVGYNTDSTNNITDFVVYDPVLGNNITNTIEGVKLTPNEVRTRGYRGANPGHYYVP